MQVKHIDIKSIKLNPNNPRLIKDDKFKKLVQSIKDFPKMLDIRPIVVNQDMIILGGNMRYKACQEAGLKEIPIIVTDLTEEQQREFLIKDNVSGGEWDWDMLANEWEVEQLEEWGLDIPINLEVELEAEEDDFEVPEGGIETDIVLGDLFEIGEHRLLCGDSTDSDAVAKLMNGQKADMVFTDPPYGIDYSGGRTQVVETKTYGKLMNDDLQGVELGELISNVFLFNKEDADVYVCVSPKMQKPFLDFIDNSGKTIDAVIVWDKKQPGLGYMAYRRQCEFILFVKGGGFKKGDTSDFDLWSISRDNGKDYVHGTQKPIGVPSRAINNSSKKDDLVLDYFGGSGSTMVASHQLKRKCYSMELDPKYCQVIIDRMKKLDPTLIIKRNGIRQD
jgi:DNA modification methylase